MTPGRKILLLVLILAGAFITVQILHRKNSTQPVAQNDKAYLTSLTNYTEFAQFAGAPLDEAYPNISSVKAVYDLQRKQIYFINSHLYRLHFDFCSKVLGYKLGLNFFNVANYGNKRDYYLANIHYLRKNKQFVLEFSSSDEIDSLQIIDMYEQVNKNSFFNGNLRLLLNNTNILNYFAKGNTMPTCDLSSLNEGLTYQAIQEGTCTGRLVICNDLKKQFLSISPNDIIVVKGAPVEVPLCKGIISDRFQTPLSHIQVLSHNKKMPSAYLANVFANENVTRYNGKMVKITVTADTLLLDPSSLTGDLHNTSQPILLSLNTTIRSIVPIEKCMDLSNADIGTKAKGLSDLKIMSDGNENLFQIPEGAFVIPFYFYKQHLQNAKIEPLLLTLQQCDLNETEKIAGILSRVRMAIDSTPISKELLSQVKTQISKNKCGESYRFRSSSNAEDLLNFSGAGLYESKSGHLNNNKRSVERAIKKVWASMYNYRAYQERRYANIDERTVAMSILAHRSFPNEDINGVIITKNLYRADYPGIVINAQKGDVSTVSPPDSVICEQLILTENRLMNPFSKKVAAKYICYSSLHPEGPLLTYDQLLLLQKSVDAIRSFYEAKNLAWDLEFKFEGGKLYIKQVRPYR